MSEKPKHPKHYKAKTHANPADHKPTMANWWFYHHLMQTNTLHREEML